MKKNNIILDKYFDGSSETLRKVTFDFDVFTNSYIIDQKKKIDQDFLEWFVGFTEGDGSFTISRPKNGKKRLFFFLVQNDIQALQRIRSTLGFGRVQKHGNAHRFAASSKADIDRLITLFNGNLLLDKTNTRFRQWVDVRNELTPNKKNHIRVKNQLKLFNYLDTGWLSGFISAEGCFNVGIVKPSNSSSGLRVRCRVILSQKDEKKVLESIRNSINSGFVSFRREDSSQFLYTLQHTDYINLLLDYLKRHPLRTKKHIDAVRMRRIINYIKSRKTQPWVGKVLMRVENLLKRLNES
jgi:hypothetical protein